MTPRELFEIVLAADVGARPRLWCESIASAENIVRSGTLSLWDLFDRSEAQASPFPGGAAIVPSIAGWLHRFVIINSKGGHDAAFVSIDMLAQARDALLAQARTIAELRASTAPAVPVGGG